MPLSNYEGELKRKQSLVGNRRDGLTALRQPLSRYARFSTSEVDEAREEAARVLCEHRLRPLSQTRQLDAWQNMVRLSSVTVGAMGYGADVEIEPGLFGDFYLLTMPYSGHATVQHGKQHADVNTETGSVLSPEDATRMRWSTDCSQLLVRIDRGALEKQLSDILGGAPVSDIRFNLAMPMVGGAARWWRMLNELIDSLETPDPIPNPLATSLHESLLLASLLNCQPNAYSERIGKPQRPIAPRHVRKVEAYIEEYAETPITLGDLVEVSGVSARALFDGFRRFRDTSPLAYLRNVRLAKVRQQLLNASDEETVTGVATQWGFYQLGRFAAQYRATFGETPSETLRRR